LFDSALAKIFAPELLNRFDATIVFSPLMPEEMENIVALQLKVLQKKLETKGINLAFSKNVLKNIAKNAFDPSMGARPIRRYIQDHVESFIAELMLSKKIDRGFKGLVDLKNGELTIS
jgi:ATP-dependent Clp protease ATP-binding subunit ClpA